MIMTLHELQFESLQEGNLENDPIFKRQFMMVSPGCSKNRIEYLDKIIPGLSPSYLEIISEFSLNGVLVDNFELSPYSFKSADIVEGLISALEDPFFPKEFMEKHNMYQIGSYNTDILCLTKGTSQFKEGEILFVEEGYDIYNPEEYQIHRLAKDFEQFLIAAGNLNQIHREINDDNSNWEEKKTEFIERLKKLGVEEVYHKAWLSVF